MRVLWSRPARDDVFAIADYYDAIDPDLAEAMVDRIDGAAWRCWPIQTSAGQS